jgi:hypothetical protein
MTPIWQAPFSTDPGSLAVVWVFGAGFLAADLVASVVVCVAAVPGAGWACAHADAEKLDSANAMMKARFMKAQEM